MGSEEVNQLQMMQQNLQNVLMQKQQIESQLTEINSALSEIQKTDQAYKILGKVMVAASKEEIKKDLSQKKEVADVRLQNIIKQEEAMKGNMETLQKKVVEGLKKNEQ